MGRLRPPSKALFGIRSVAEKLRVLALEPYYSLSHATFLEGYARYSRHEVEAWRLPARKWKWRMRGAAYHFADRARATPAAPPDAILASDFLNLADWRALAPRPFRDAPAALYFHENQATYPLGAAAPKDFHYGWINLSSALAAERVLFNSSYHREAFLAETGRTLARMPEPVPEDLPGRIRERSAVFPVGIDFEAHRGALARRARSRNDPPVIVWNHRWEEDKGPEALFDALRGLRARGVPFRAIVCGEEFTRKPAVFEEAARDLRKEILHMGFFHDRAEYLDALAGADVVLSTARHEFFGVSVVEAIYMGCLPVLPNALSYPEIIPPGLHRLFLYDPAGLTDFLAAFLDRPPEEHRETLREATSRFDWRTLAPNLDAIIEALPERR
jgi:glycosyltransferase involved in cell wall biosynthesis